MPQRSWEVSGWALNRTQFLISLLGTLVSAASVVSMVIPGRCTRSQEDLAHSWPEPFSTTPAAIEVRCFFSLGWSLQQPDCSPVYLLTTRLDSRDRMMRDQRSF